MLRYLKANMGIDPSPLADAMKLAQAPRGDMNKTMRIGLAWMTTRKGILWHNGETGGYRSFIGFTADGRHGVVVLSNTDADPCCGRCAVGDDRRPGWGVVCCTAAEPDRNDRRFRYVAATANMVRNDARRSQTKYDLGEHKCC